MSKPEKNINSPEKSQLKSLIAKGKEQGFLTYAEVNDHLPNEIIEPEQIEDIVNMINDMGITVYESPPENDNQITDATNVLDEDAAAEAAAALANIDVIERGQMLENVREVGPYLQERLRELIDIPMVGDVRGVGVMGCLECVVSKESRQPLELDYDVGNRIDSHCQVLGLLLRPLINMCVVSPPIVISREQIDQMVGILRVGIERTMVDLEREGIAQFNYG